jgi:hypothetical protein
MLAAKNSRNRSEARSTAATINAGTVGRMRAYCARVGVEYDGEPRGHRRGRRIAAGQNVGEFVVAVVVGDERVAIRAVGPHSIDRSWAFNANESLVAIGDDQEERFGASVSVPV